MVKKEKTLEFDDILLTAGEGEVYRIIIEAIERPLIESILERTEGNQLKTAKILGINRNTLRSKIRKLGIKVQHWRS